MTHSLAAPRRAVTLTLTLALALAGLVGVFGVQTADAAAPPPVVQPDSSSGVTSDALPTTQINNGGWVWDQAIVGDTVYAGGSFSSARPAGAAAGSNETTRNNLLAYSISTGELVDSFNPGANGTVRVLALSPDKSRLYVGGDFTTIGGATHTRIAAISTATGQVDPSFNASVGSVSSDHVYAITATDSTVYVGGSFTSANGSNRGRLAAFRASDGALISSWLPKTDGQAVKALLVAPGGNNVVVGGQFASVSKIGSSTVTAAKGSASLDADTGDAKAWAVNTVVKQYGGSGGVLSLKTDGTTVFGSGFWYGGTDSNYEGVWAVSPTDGSIKWLADCHGDTYDTTVVNDVVYAASHQHDCSNIGSFPEQRPTRIEWRANAFTADAQGDVQTNALSPTKFSSFTGYQAPAVINWFPRFAAPTSSSNEYATQPTLTIESNSDYVVVGGQFTSVNAAPQQGLVRFARRSIAPKADGPRLYYSDSGNNNAAVGAPTVRAVGSNAVRVTAAPWDRDSAILTKVELWRSDKSSPIWSASNVTSLWWKNTISFVDRDVTAGKYYKYYVKATDPDGNTTTSSTAGALTPSNAVLSDSAYSQQVLADGASHYWRMNDQASSTAATDWVGATDLTLNTGAKLGSSGAIGSDDPGLSVDGTTKASAAANNGDTPAPQTFSVEAWFRTSSTTGGQVVGFGDVPTGTSYRHDRQVYLNSSGNLLYYLDQNGSSKQIKSPNTYNDGQWHQVVATLSSGSGMVLYVDGARAASWSAITSARDYRGFWRIGGGDVLPSGTTGNLSGGIDDVSTYPSALSATQVKDHFTDSGRTAKATPNAAFSMTCQSLSCGFDGSQSTPDRAAADAPAAGATAADPTMRDYRWSFGDGASGKDVKTSHSYGKAGSFDVSLTVTNSAGASATTTQSLDAKASAVPVAKFTSKVKGKKVSVDAKASSSANGKLTKYRWTFGDGATSTKAKTSHTYVGTGTYPVSLTVTDSKGSTGKTSATVVVGKALASDTFQRSGAGWGTATKGGAWTVTPAGAFSTTDGKGRITLDDPGSQATALLSKVSTTKANVVADVTPARVGTGSGTTVAHVLRQRGKDAYRVELVLGPKGTASLIARRLVGGQSKVVKTVTVKSFTYSAGETLRFRATISSAKKAKIKATVWEAGTKEPKAQLSTTDSTKALRRSGAVGVDGSLAQSATTAPVVIDVDNLFVTSS